MKKARRFFGILTFFLTLAFLAGQPYSLLSQPIKEDKAQDRTINSSTPAKTEAQAREEQEKAEAKKAAAQASAEAQAKAERQKAEAKIAAETEQARRDYETILKTYSLKYISVEEFIKAAKLYIFNYSGPESALTVQIYRKNIPAFEELLKKLDVEKRNIQFQVYTIVASKDEEPPGPYKDSLKNETKEIANKDLKKVLDEMKGLWNFKHYWLDSPSFLMVKDGSVSNTFRLVSSRHLNMFIRRVQLRGDEPGKRTISVGQIKLTEEIINSPESTLIETSDINFKEKGYLVVGVSGFTSGWAGMALILVINAEIK